MGTIEYSLFRVKMIRPNQSSFLDDITLTPRQLFETSIEEKPSNELRPGQTWHIGNVLNYTDTTGYFAFGKTTKTTYAKFNAETGDFFEEDFETSPYTHTVFDSGLGIVGIAHNHRLSRRSTTIANRLQRVLSESTVAKDNRLEVLVAPITDPTSFVTQISQAASIMRFTAHFTGPNPFDADEYFQKPLSVYAQKANAKRGKAQVEGEDLNKETIAEVAKSTAASGNKASARIRRKKNQSPVTISLGGDPVKRSFDESHHQPKNVITELAKAYKEVRSDERD